MTDARRGADRASSDTEETFRAELRAWLAVHPGPGPGAESHLLDGSLTQGAVAAQRKWQRQLFEAGWAGVAWPTAHGGRAASARELLVFHEEYERAGGGGNDLFFVGLGHAGPTIITHGTPDQQARYLPGILRGDLLFCQCFSEPGAGSDLAAVATRAVVDGDHLVVSGEKRWSTAAQYADHAEMLVRTDTASRHGGLTFVIADMHAPGVEVRPTRTADGHAHFAEVYFDDALVPLADVVGPIGGGWAVASTTLAAERSTAFAGPIMSLEPELRAQLRDAQDDPVARDELGALGTRALAVAALLDKAVSEQEGGRPLLASGALKLLASELYYDVIKRASAARPDRFNELVRACGLRIGGGTSEIQRSIIAERILGLPKG